MVRSVETFISRRLPVERTSIVDVQGYRKNQEFILKSLCVLDLFTFQFFVVHFKPPCSAEELSALDVKTNKFIYENLNGKPWESGEYPYHERSKIISPILQKYDRIYLKGTEKIRWINMNASCERVNFVDLLNYGCPSLEKCKENLKSFMRRNSQNLQHRQWPDELVLINVLAIFMWLNGSNNVNLLYPFKYKISSGLDDRIYRPDQLYLEDARDLIHWVSNNYFFVTIKFI